MKNDGPRQRAREFLANINAGENTGRLQPLMRRLADKLDRRDYQLNRPDRLAEASMCIALTRLVTILNPGPNRTVSSLVAVSARQVLSHGGKLHPKSVRERIGLTTAKLVNDIVSAPQALTNGSPRLVQEFELSTWLMLSQAIDFAFGAAIAPGTIVEEVHRAATDSMHACIRGALALAGTDGRLFDAVTDLLEVSINSIPLWQDRLERSKWYILTP